MSTPNSRSCPLVVALAALILAGLPHAANAVDGVIEINQAKALAGGVTPGDTAGFPVIISESGSYRLTSNLSVAIAANHAIRIPGTVENVTIDLNGFSITGPNSCSGGGSSIECSFSSGGHGILLEQGINSVRITNGTIQGMGGSGIAGNAVNTLVDGVTVRENGLHGVQCNRCQIRRSVMALNRRNGIICAAACVITENRIEGNGGDGVNTAFGLHGIHRNIINGQGGFGIDTRGANVITENVVFGDDSGGIHTTQLVGNGSRVEGNTVHANTGHGIEVGVASAVEGNSVYDNTDVGLVLGAGSGYVGNVIDSNTGGTVSGGIQMGTNVCDGNTTCP